MVLSQVERTGYTTGACRKAAQSCAVFTYSVIIDMLDMLVWYMLEAGMGIFHSLFSLHGPLVKI